MALGRTILGLDIGTYSIKACELQQSLRETQVVQLREMQLESDGPGTVQLLRSLILTHKLPTEYVICALEGAKLSSRRIHFPFTDKKKIAQAVPFEVESQTPFDLEEIVVGWQRVGGDRTQSDVVATIAQRTQVARLLETLEEADIEPRVVESEGFVLGNLGLLFDLPGVRLLADIGHTQTTLCLLRDGEPVGMRTIPVAGLALTEALAKDRGVPVIEAERIKHEDGIFKRGFESPDTEAVAALDRLAREIKRSLASFAALQADGAPPIEEITLFGGTAHLHRIDEYLTERIGIRAARLAFPRSAAGPALVAAGDPLRFGAACALALRGSLRARTHMNFRQDEFGYRMDMAEIVKRFRVTAGLVAAAILLFFLGNYFSSSGHADRAQEMEQQVAKLYQQAFPGRPVPKDVERALEAAVKSARDRADFLGVYRGNLSALDLLQEISSRVPADLDIELEELNVDRKSIRIRGRAADFAAVDRLANQLREFEVFSRVEPGEVTRDTRRGGNSFTLTISLADPGERG